MPGADGSISFITTLDNTQLEKDLSKTNKKILELEKNIHFANAMKIPLSEQADELVGMLDAAKAKLYEMQSAEKNTFSDKEIAAQQEAVNILQSKCDSVQKHIET